MLNKLTVALCLLAICAIGCGSQSSNPTNPNPALLRLSQLVLQTVQQGVSRSECPTVDSSGRAVGYCGGTIKVTFNRPVETSTVGISVREFAATTILGRFVECVTPAGTKFELCGPGVNTSNVMVFVTSTDLNRYKWGKATSNRR